MLVAATVTVAMTLDWRGGPPRQGVMSAVGLSANTGAQAVDSGATVSYGYDSAGNQTSLPRSDCRRHPGIGPSAGSGEIARRLAESR